MSPECRSLIGQKARVDVCRRYLITKYYCTILLIPVLVVGTYSHTVSR